MANITRIKNNQITDSNVIAYAKVAPGTITGNLIASTLTMTSDVTIVGNLAITGNSSTINSVNTFIQDPLVTFNAGYTGSVAGYDIGMLVNRNFSSLGPYGAVNTAWVWVEADQAFEAIATATTGNALTGLTSVGFANVKLGNTTAVTGSISGTLNVTGETTLTTATTGGLQAVAIGNVTPGTGVFTTLSATGEITLNTISAASFQGVIGNVTPAAATFTTAQVNSTLGVTGETTLTTATTGGLQAVAIGNVTPGTAAFTTLTASGATTLTNSTVSTSTSTGALVVTGGVGIGGAVYAGTAYDNGNRVVTAITSSGSGNLTIGGTAPTLTVALPATGPGVSTWGGATQIPSLTLDAYGRVSTAGNTALNTVAVTELGNTPEITANATVGLVGLNLTTTGVTAGGYGSASVIPTIVVDSKGRITSITTNAASTSFTVGGTSGTTTVSAGSTLTLAGTYGVTVAVGDTYANISTPQDLRTTADPTFNNLTTASVQGVIGNVTPAAGTFTTGAFDTATTGGLQAKAIGNVTPGTGAFTTLTAQTETVGGLQAVAIGNVTPGTGVFTTGTFDTATTGGLQAVAIGNVTPGTGAFTTATATTVNAATIGNTGATLTGTLSTAAQPNVTSLGTLTGLTVSGTSSLDTVTGASFQGVIGNVTPTTGAFTTATATTVNAATIGNSGAVLYGTLNSASAAQTNITSVGTLTGLTVSGTSQLDTVTGASFQGVIGNVTPETGAFTTATATTVNAATIGNSGAVLYGTLNSASAAQTNITSVGTLTGLTVSGASQLDTVTAASIQAPIGNATPNTGAFTTLTSTGTTTLGLTSAGAINSTPIGNATPSTGAFTTLSASGALSLTNADESTSDTTGALIVSGGVGIAKNLNVGGNVVVSGNLTVQGTMTAIQSQTLDVTDLNITVAKGASTAAAANGAGLTVDGAGATLLYTSATDSWNLNKELIGTGASFSNSTASTSTTTGALVVTGGVGIGGDVYASSIQNTPIGSTTASTGAFTTTTTGGLQAVAIGNVTPGTAAFTTATTGGLQAVAIGNVTPGTGTFTTLTATTLSLAAINGTVIGNVTPEAGTFTTLNAQTETVGGLQAVAIGNVTPGTAVFTTATTGGLQAVAIGNVTPGTAVFTTQTTGGLQAVAIGNVTPGTGVFTTGTFDTATTGGLQAVAIGNVTPGTAVFTTQTTGGLQAVAIGNVTPGTAVFTTATTGGLQAVAIGNVTPGTGVFTTVTATTVNAATIGNTGATLTGTLSTAAQPNVTSLGTLTGLTVSGTSSLDTVTGASFQGVIGNVTPAAGTFTTVNTGGLQAVAIGNVTPGTGVFTTGTFDTATTGGLQAVAIGNVTPGTGAFTTLTSSGATTVTSGTDSTSTSTGALVVTGGVGVSGNLALGGEILLGGNPGTNGQALTSTGAGLQWTTLLFNEIINGTSNIQIASSGGPAVVTINNANIAAFSSTGLAVNGNLSVNAASISTTTDGNIYFTSPGGGTFNFIGTSNTDGILSAPNLTAYSNHVSTSVNSGALKVFGGAGITGNVYALGFEGPIGTYSPAAGAFTTLTASGATTLTNATESTSSSTGALIVTGGVGIGGNLYVANDIWGNANVHVHEITGTILTVNSATVNEDATIDGVLTVTSNVVIDGGSDTVSPTTGALLITGTGGAAVNGNVYVGNALFVGIDSQNSQVESTLAVFRGTSGAGPEVQFTQVATINTTNTGSADVIAYADNGTNEAGWMDMGMAGSQFNDPAYTITAPEDGYIFTHPSSDAFGGNLVISTSDGGSHNDIVIGVGSFLAEAEVARFHGNTSNNGSLVIKLPTTTTGANTGALQVWGGTSTSGNSYVGENQTVTGNQSINSSQAAGNALVVSGYTDATLLYAKAASAYDAVIIGGSGASSSFPDGAKLVVNSVDSMLLPSGATSDRPGTGVQGMFRYNSTLGATEWFNGTAWKSTQSSFTVIADQQFNGDGSTVAFTLGSLQTTASCIVSINGVVQIPTLAYSVSGTTLTFTEAPLSGDVIDVRQITTTTTVLGLEDDTGYNTVTVSADGVKLTTGTSAADPVVQWNTAGAEVNLTANVTIASAATPTTADSFAYGTYSSAEYLVTATISGTTIRQVQKVLLVTDGTGSYVTAYGGNSTAGNILVTFGGTVTGSNAVLQATVTNANTILRIKKNYQAV